MRGCQKHGSFADWLDDAGGEGLIIGVLGLGLDTYVMDSSLKKKKKTT